MNQFARPGLAVTELPPVNADDNGKVLGVSDGAWTKVAASGGSDLPDDPAQDGTYNLQNTVSSGTGTLSWASGSGGGVLVVNDVDGTLDKTWAEIAEAVPEKPVLIISVTGIITTVAFVVGVQRALKPGMKHYVTAFSPAADFASSIGTFSANTSGDYPVIVQE